jgi:hypothetical protein
MRVSSDHSPLSPEEGKFLHEVLADLIDDFGLSLVKHEVNRLPKPRANGRPKVWDECRLFSLWLIVQAWALRGNHSINSACKLLEKSTGGLTMYTESGGRVLVEDFRIIRKEFYKADAELDKHDVCHKHSMTPRRTQFGPLRNRLNRHAQSLSKHEPFFTSYGEIANRIVRYELADDEPCDPAQVRFELVQDGVGRSNKGPDRSAHPPDRAELEAKITYLKERLDAETLKEVLKRFPESKRQGRQEFWYPLRLFTLWFVIQNIASFQRSPINQACDQIAKMGGIFEFFDDDLGVRNKLASSPARIRRLYYDAEKAFDIFEQDLRRELSNSQSPSLKEQLDRLARDMASKQVVIPPIISLAIKFVKGCLRSEGICHDDSFEIPEPSETEVDIRRVKFVSDGHGRWRLNPPEIWRR